MSHKRTSLVVPAFTLIELLTVIGIISMLLTILMPSLAKAKSSARQTVCAGNLRHMHEAFLMYLTDSRWEYFPYQQKQQDGTLWYWGFEPAGAATPEGDRPLDAARARLAPYLGHSGRARICPQAASSGDYFKPKFKLAGYGYAINQCMLSDNPQVKGYGQLTMPHETITWADSMQINTWQAPASASSPMLEDWYYLDNRVNTPATFHFRHRNLCSAAFADGSVRELQPYWLDRRCDGKVGRPEPPCQSSAVSYLLRVDK